MRLDTAREETITNLSGSQKFKMNASAKAFQILSSGIYERKIEAIVRELSCNAYDSHIQAGKKDVPFRIQLPTPINDFIFAIEDFGVGLSEDEVYNVYTTYFESTKTDSNDVIGALGLGSKTPFSYTDSFTVKARKDGKECVFSAQISASGEPEVVKMYERPWTGDNGVEVSVEVASKDVREFYSCAEKVLSWFDVKPVCNRELVYDVDGDAVANVRQYGYHLERKFGFGRQVDCKVIMGNVAYDLDLSDLKADRDSDVGKFIDQLYNMKADVYFSVAIGDADVAASRETLSLDDRTKANLINKLEEIRKNFKKTTMAKLPEFSSVFEAVEKLTAYERAVVEKEVINGYTIVDYRKRNGAVQCFINYEDRANPTAREKHLESIFDDYDIAIYGDFGRSWKTPDRSKRESSCDMDNLHVDYKIPVVINDCERKMGLKDALIANTTLRSKVVVVSDKNTKLTPRLEEILNYMTMNNFEVIYASSFWDGKLSTNKSTSTGLAEETVKAQTISKNSSYFAMKKVDLSAEDKTRWAYIDYTQGIGRLIFSDNRNVMASDGDLRNLMQELDLDGIIGYNGNNEKKVKRILGDSRNLSSLVEKNADRKAYTSHIVRREMINRHNEVYMIFDSYANMYNAIMQSTVSNKATCSKLFYNRTVTDYNAELAVEKSLDNRMEVFKKKLKILKENSEVLKFLLTFYNFNSKMVPEVKQIIKMKMEG